MTQSMAPPALSGLAMARAVDAMVVNVDDAVVPNAHDAVVVNVDDAVVPNAHDACTTIIVVPEPPKTAPERQKASNLISGRCAGVSMRKSRMERDTATIREWCSALGIGADSACAEYRAAIEKGVQKGRYSKIVMAGAVYVAARKAGTPITIDEVARHTGVGKWYMGRVSSEIDGDLPRLTVHDFVRRGVDALSLPQRVIDSIDVDAVRSDISPPIRAAVALYSAARRGGLEYEKGDVCAAVGTQHVSIRQYVGINGDLLPRAVAE